MPVRLGVQAGIWQKLHLWIESVVVITVESHCGLCAGEFGRGDEQT